MGIFSYRAQVIFVTSLSVGFSLLVTLPMFVIYIANIEFIGYFFYDMHY